MHRQQTFYYYQTITRTIIQSMACFHQDGPSIEDITGNELHVPSVVGPFSET